MTQSKNLFTREFLVLNITFFIASATMSVFFQFHRYLHALGIDPGWFGFIIAADSLASLCLQPFISPFLSARNGRKWMCVGIAIMVSALLCYSRAITLPWLIAVRIVHGAGFVLLISAMMALIVDFIPHDQSGRAFGFISLVRLVPYAFVPPLVNYLYRVPADFTEILMYNALLMGLCLAPLLFIKVSPVTPDGSHGQGGFYAHELFEDLRDPKVLIVLIVNLLLYSGYTAIFFFLEGYGKKIGVNNPGLFFTIATMVMIGVRLFAGSAFDRVNKGRLAALCMAGLTLCYAALSLSGNTFPFYAIGFFVGFGWGIVMPVLNALMFDISVPCFRGLNLNLSLVMMQGGFFVGPLAGGFVLGSWGYGALFCFCSALSLLAAILLPLIAKNGPREQLRV